MSDVDRYLEAATRQNTQRSYASALRHFEVEWGGHLPATPDSVARYLAEQAPKAAINTLKQRLAALAHWHAEHGFVDPTRTPLVRKVLKGIQTLHPRIEKQATPLQLAQLTQVVGWLDQATLAAQERADHAYALRAMRDKALVLLGFWRGFRGDELIRLQIEYLELVPEQGMICFLPRSKGDRQSAGNTYKVPALSRLCAVSATQAWVQAAALTQGPLFRRVDQWGNVGSQGLHPNSLIPLLRDLFQSAGLEAVGGYSSHSLRRGFAGWANDNGWDVKALMEYVGWRDVHSAMRYIQGRDPFARQRVEAGLQAAPPPALASAALPAPAATVSLTLRLLVSPFTPRGRGAGRARARIEAMCLSPFQAHRLDAEGSEYRLRIRQHIAQAAGLRRALSIRDLNRYDVSGAKRAHMARLRKFLRVRPLDVSGREWLATVAQAAAQTKHVIADIINVLLEELVHHRFELPGFSTLEKIAVQAREQVHEQYYRSINEALTAPAKSLIKELLAAPANATYTGWNALKREPKRPTNKEVRFYLQHIQRLQHLAQQLPAVDIPVPKLKQFRAMARALDASELAELKPAKRYALATIFIRSQYAKTLDDAADLYIRLMQNLENTAQQRLLAYQVEHGKRADTLIAQLKEILQAYQIDGTDTQRVDAIGLSLVADISTLLAECDEHMAYAGRNYLPFLIQPYSVVRPLLFNCLEIMQLRSTSQDAGMERMIAALLSLRGQRRDMIEASSIGLDVEKDLGWLSVNWRRHVFGRKADSLGPGWVHRKYFELAVLAQIKDELKSGDLFIPHGERYDDYREQLVDEATFAQELEAYGEVSGLATEASEFVRHLQQELSSLADTVDARFPENVHADVVDGRLVLRKLQRPEISSAIATVDALITERLPAMSIVDVLIDAAQWLKLHRHFRPIAGTNARVDDLMRRVITTLFCYGCNLGPTQTARSIKGFSRRQISWLNLKYVTEDTLDKAIVQVINTFNKFDLPGYWGSGKSASADGTKWSMYEQNLLSEYHIRYGGYGGIGYYHVSDKYVALFSHFIPCGVHEAIYILDGLLANTSDIQPEIVHGDTQAQSYPVFGLSYLLGIQLMPRIRNIKDLTFFRAEAGRPYKNIQALFGDSIDWGLIETHLHDMLRVTVSIKLGKITASTILRRLGTYSRKNKLYFAFRELGKVIRTLFLLRYIDDVDMRRTIQAATNKSEEFNGFVKWVFFGGEGIIAENVLHEQRKVVKYNQLVANMIILHNVDQMTRTLASLQEEGMELNPEVLGGLSPYRTSHINRFGDYTLDLERKVAPLQFTEIVLEPHWTQIAEPRG